MASESIVIRDSFDSPGDADNASHWPESILLAQEGYVAASRNDTTATAKSRVNHTVEVTFWIADPPAVSFYTFHYFKPPISDRKVDDLEAPPRVVGAQGRFILLSTCFASGDGDDEYFIYKGDPKSPSLESVPHPDDDRLRGVSDFGIVTRGDGGHYLLLSLRHTVDLKDYRLDIYSSEDRTWRTKKLLNPCPGIYMIIPEKVIMLRDGMLCWVDFKRGILVCDVLQEPLHARYIPLPWPVPANREKMNQVLAGTKDRRFRDVTFVDGVIKFIEMVHRGIVREIRDVSPERPCDPRHKDVLYDSDLIKLIEHKPVDNKSKMLHLMKDWSAMTWTREVGSNCWLKRCTVDFDDSLVDDSAISALLSTQGNESTGSLPFKNLYLAWPILSTDANDLLYLKVFRNQYAYVVAVDLAAKTLKVEAPRAHPFGRYSPSEQSFRPCALSNHLKMTPGIKVSASQIAQTGSSANEPNNTAICVGEPDSYESENKRPRLSAEKVNPAQNGAEGTIQNVLSSRVHPEQNNMPPQLCFSRWGWPGYGGYSPWPCQNNPNVPRQPPPPPQCFNQWGGPYNPQYAQLAPAPNIHSYGNYQSLWQQPPPLAQHTTASRVPLNYQSLWQQPPPLAQHTTASRAPHEAPRPYFNNSYGASYHGNSQQLPGGNSYL